MDPGDDPKQRILTAATQLFANRGFDGTPVQAVAEAVGIRGPSLLYHYRTKDQLRAAVLDNLLGHWKNDLPRALAAAQSGGDRLDSALRAMLGFFRDQPDRARLLLREMLDRPDEVRALFATHLQPWTRLLTDYIRLGQAEGRVRTELDPEAYVLHIVTVGIGTIATADVTSALFPESLTPSVDARIAELVRVARAGLFNPRPA